MTTPAENVAHGPRAGTQHSIEKQQTAQRNKLVALVHTHSATWRPQEHSFQGDEHFCNNILTGMHTRTGSAAPRLLETFLLETDLDESSPCQVLVSTLASNTLDANNEKKGSHEEGNGAHLKRQVCSH